MLKAELRQIKKALACRDKKVRELTTRLETETEDKTFLSHQNRYLSAEIKKMQTLQLESTDDKIQTLEKVMQSCKAKLQEKTQELDQCLEEAEQQSHDFKEIMKHAEQNEVKKIHEIKLMTEKKLQTEKETNIKLKVEMTIMTQRFSNFQKHFDEKGTELYMLKQEKQQLLGLTRSQQSEIEDLKEQNEKTSQEKDGTILGLKQKNHELEGLRFIHDLKFSEFKKQFEPQQDEIKEKRQSIGQLQEKLRQTGNNYNTLTMITSDLRLKLKSEGTEPAQ